jgi:hypothetical protein
LFAAETASAEEERGEDLLHADSPLWTAQSDVMWPRHFIDGDSFGCSNRMEYGDWRLDEEGADADPTWYRFSNYGVFHCALLVSDADAVQELRGRRPDPSFLVELGTAAGRDGNVELWALQRGMRPGSSYLLLSRQPGPGAIREFTVLQRVCPRGRMRDSPSVDSFLTRYCAIGSRTELLRLARRMASRPPLGRLVFAQAVEELD